MRFRAGARTDVGLVREGNEDGFMADEPLFAVADGMGGHQGGEVASQLALETLGRSAPDPETDGAPAEHLADVVRQANQVVLERASTDPGLQGMGTTLTALLAHERTIHLAHVGDSRAYLLRDGDLRRLTKDHTVVERLVDQGRLTPQEAEIHPQRSILTNALGVDSNIQVDESTVELRQGDRILLCSDGLTGMVGDEEIARMLKEIDDPQAAAEALVDAANEAGGQDNITVVVLDALGDDDARVTAGPAAVARQPEGGSAGSAATQAPPMGDTAPRRAVPAGVPARRWPRSVLLWGVLPLLVIAGVLWAVKTLFIDKQWFVGVDEASGNVALFQGIPAEPLGVSLTTLVEVTDIPADDVRRFPAWDGIDAGITADSREDGENIIQQMETDLTEQEQQDQKRQQPPDGDGKGKP